MTALGDLVAFLLPVPCAGCGVEGRTLCRACRAELRPRPGVHAIAGVGPVHSGLVYDGVARRAVLAVKESGSATLADALADAFAAGVAASLDGRGVDLVPVPSSRPALRRRGFEPVRLLARRCGIRLLPAFAPARPHAAQKSLDADARAANLAGAFALARPVAGRRIVLVDDVVTTGATLAEAARVLTAGGAEVLGGAVLAATPRRSSHSARTPGSGS